MKISSVYIGGWFQRTMLQLSEVYDFLRGTGGISKLSEKKLAELLEALEIESLSYGISGEEYLQFKSKSGIAVKIFEDGLITLNNRDVNSDTLVLGIQKVQEYYEKRLSPAINYLFSLGAPVPKELANIENVYPYFIVLDKASKNDMTSLLEQTDKQKYFEFNNDKYDVVRGDKYYFINNKAKKEGEIERYIEEQIFIREFKGQMHRYLNIHRVLWERIDEVKARKAIRGSDIMKVTTKLEAYKKTITLIDGRIKQMSTYLPTREKIAKNDKDLTEFLKISGYRYEALGDTLSYITYLWDMTRNYAESAQKQFESLKVDATRRSVMNLTTVAIISAGAVIINLLCMPEPNLTWSWLFCVVVLGFIGWCSSKILRMISGGQKYDVADVGYEKNIK